MADPTRRRVLALLREKPMSAGELADQFDVSKPTMSAPIPSEAGFETARSAADWTPSASQAA